ncbi:MAG: glycosyltransferase family 2 protein [Chloroflexi bacterium]|nr:glycosyltransferase family 2 protein [Chloroflexota bacterium]
MKLSVIIPVYNERGTIRELLQRVRAVDAAMEKELVVVDDYSTDGTREILAEEAASPDVRLMLHPVNRGKGAAVRTGLEHATGNILLVQDADLEYDPTDYPILLQPILSGQTKAVYGSRFLGNRKDMTLSHAWGNRIITIVANLLYRTKLTDVETCYKVFTSEVKDKIHLKAPRWGFDPEITARILKNGYRIVEVPIHYAGRAHDEGKKISWRDAFVVLWTLLKYRFVD